MQYCITQLNNIAQHDQIKIKKYSGIKTTHSTSNEKRATYTVCNSVTVKI